jgi:phage shock protein PspC (stress-responsive transcriptional regulator)
VLLLMVVPGSQLLIYPVLWILMPSEESINYPASDASYPTV